MVTVVCVLMVVGCQVHHKDIETKITEDSSTTEGAEPNSEGTQNHSEDKASYQEGDKEDGNNQGNESQSVDSDIPTDEEVEFNDNTVESESLIHEEGNNLLERFKVPEGYKRVDVEEGSFAAYLRQLPLKEHGSKVLYHDGREKNRKHVYLAVVDMEIGKRNLHQCADAIIRLRGEYFYAKEDYHKIHFNFTSGFRVDYSKWMEGYRVRVQGNDVAYVKSGNPSNTYEDFRKYMELIYAYAGTLSLAAELESVLYREMKIGDVFIQGGSPGHAVIVVDMASHEASGEKVYMLAQSYMPAQETQILCNPEQVESPWYPLDRRSKIRTPEWTFKPQDLKEFVNE